MLLVGPGLEATVGAWRASGARTQHVVSGEGLEHAGRDWDLVILAGALERERWDRWLVQRIHHVLAPGGQLAMRVPNLLDVFSPRGLAYFLSRAWRELTRRFARRGAIPAADRSRFAGRRYRPGPLAAMVASVGFETAPPAPVGHSLPRPLAAALGGFGRRTARELFVLAKKHPSLWGPGRDFPERESFLSGFRARHAEAMERRDAWRARFGPSGAPVEPELAEWARRGAVVLSPHPDDEVIGCGGTLVDLVERGGQVTIVQATDGSDSAAFIDEPEDVRRRVRLDEARVIADRLGAHELVCLAADNRALRASPELRDQVRDVLERTGAGLVFAPGFTDVHPDHQTVLRLLADAMRGLRGERPDVALYEVWSFVSPTHVHAVDARIERIEALLLAYETALKVDDYAHLVAERLLYNSYEYHGRAGYAEVFERLTAERFLELAESHFGAGQGT